MTIYTPSNMASSSDRYHYSSLFSSGLRMMSSRQSTSSGPTLPWPRDESTAEKPSSLPSSSTSSSRTRSSSLSYWRSLLTSKLFARTSSYSAPGNGTTTPTPGASTSTFRTPDEKAAKTARRRTVPNFVPDKDLLRAIDSYVLFSQYNCNGYAHLLNRAHAIGGSSLYLDEKANFLDLSRHNSSSSTPSPNPATPSLGRSTSLRHPDDAIETNTRRSRPRPVSLPLLSSMSTSAQILISHPYRSSCSTESSSQLDGDSVLEAHTDSGAEADFDDDDSSLSDDAELSDASSEEWDVDELVDAVGSGAADAESDTLGEGTDGDDWRRFHIDLMGL